MNSAIVNGPVNPSQLAATLPAGWLLTDHGDGTFTIASDTYTAAQITAAYQSIIYDANYQPPAVANRATLQQRAVNALTANATYLAIATPTTAQMRDQLAAITKECSGLIRLLLNQVDTTSGT